MEISASIVTLRNIKALSTQAGANTDGIDAWNCTNVLYDNCFNYGRDDAIAFKSMLSGYNLINTTNIMVSSSIFSSLESCMKIGTETERDTIRHITFENCDALYAGNAMFIWGYDKAFIKNIYFRHIGVERLKPSSFTNQGTNFYMEMNVRVGSIKPKGINNVVAEKITCEQKGLNFHDYMVGYSNQKKIDQVAYNDLTVANTLVTNSNKATYFNIGNYVTNLNFGTNSAYPLVSLSATQNDITKGQSASFTITRSGNTSAAATVNYIIRGNASMGYDYATIASSVTFNIGETSKTVLISSVADTYTEQIEQVCIQLQATVTKNYMLSSNFMSVINIRDAGYVGNIILSRNTLQPLLAETDKNKINEKQIEENGIADFPSPANNKIYITGIKKSKKESIVYVTDMSDKICLQKKVNSTAIEINVSTLARGTYLIKVGNQLPKKIVLQ